MVYVLGRGRVIERAVCTATHEGAAWSVHTVSAWRLTLLCRGTTFQQGSACLIHYPPIPNCLCTINTSLSYYAFRVCPSELREATEIIPTSCYT